MTKLRAWNCLSALVITLLLSAILPAVPSALAQSEEGTWIIETVDDIDVFNTSLKIDSDDNPCISYSTFDLTSLHYAHRTASGWVTTTVDADPTLGSSLALDRSNQPRIGYSKLFSLDYASKAGGVWTLDNVLPPGPYLVWDCSLALDSRNQPHMTSTAVALAPGPLFALIYTYRTAGVWQPPQLISEDFAFASSLALDRNDRPCVSYSDLSSSVGNLMYARFIDEGWTTEPVDPDNPGEVVSTSLAMDSNNRPNIAYATIDTTGSLHFARWTGSEWELQTVDPASEVWDCELTLDSQNHPHICYLVTEDIGETETIEIKYAEWTGEAWDIQTVAQETGAVAPMKALEQHKMDILQQASGVLSAESIDSAGQFPFTIRFCSIAVDSNDLPHISYGSLFSSTNSLHYASFTPAETGTPTTTPPTSPGSSPPLNVRLLNPANMSVQFLTINPQQTAANQLVTISTNVVNTGDQAGSYNVALKINGQVEQTKMVAVGPQASQPVKFTVTKAQPGTYAVDIVDQKGSFTVLGGKSDTSNNGSNMGLIIVLAVMAVLVVATMVALLTRRR